jgi:hypothetical protein
MTNITEHYPIKPEHINTTQRFWDGFGNMEAGDNATRIVILCQEAGNWIPFTEADMEKRWGKSCYSQVGALLTRGDYLIKNGDKYTVTHEFVTRCFLSSPNLQ